MTRQERKDFTIGITMCAVFVIVAVWLYTIPADAKMAVFEDGNAVVEEITVDDTEGPEMADFDADSAMPCCDPEGFQEWYATYEEPTEAEPDIQIYRIAGESIDAELQRLLYHYLSEAGIEYWYTGALAQMFQESHCRQYAENPNGLDKGIYQFRTTYWNWSDGDIFDVDAQIRRYVSEMAARFNAGLSMDEAISRHKTSDYVTTVDWTYVSHVKQWLNQMEAIR